MNTAETRADSFRVFEESASERLAAYLQRLAEPVPLRARTKQEWIQRRGVIREQALAGLGLAPLPERQPLDPQFGEVTEVDGGTLQPVSWRTWPEVRAAGWLCTPENAGAAAPGVLIFPGTADPSDTRRALLTLAALGFTALALEPVEARDDATGLTRFTLDVFAGLRGLDFLAGRSNVDRERLGIYGTAGGAAAATLLAALDDRPRVIVLSEAGSTGAIPAAQNGPLPEICPPGLLAATSWTELMAVPSPRALLWLHSEAGAPAPPEEALAELLAIYRLWQQPDRLAFRALPEAEPCGRGEREAAYAWFVRELGGDRSILEVSEPELAPGVLPPLIIDGSTCPPAQVAEGVRDWYRKRVPAQPPQLESRQSRRNYQERVREELSALLGRPEPVTLASEGAPRTALDLSQVSEGQSRTTRPIDRVSFRSEWGVRVPAIWVPGQGAPPWRTLVAVHPDGKAAAMRSELVRGLQREGYAILAPDVRFCGEQKLDEDGTYAAWGRPVAGMALTDVLACVEWLFGHPDVDPKSLAVWGTGSQGVVALLAAGTDERISVTVADCGRTTYRDGGDGLPVIPNVLRVADVPQIASLIAPRRLWLYGVPEERVGFSSRRYYDWTRRSYQSLGEPDALMLSTGETPEAAAFWEWLNTRPRRSKR